MSIEECSRERESVKARGAKFVISRRARNLLSAAGSLGSLAILPLGASGVFVWAGWMAYPFVAFMVIWSISAAFPLAKKTNDSTPSGSNRHVGPKGEGIIASIRRDFVESYLPGLLLVALVVVFILVMAVVSGG